MATRVEHSLRHQPRFLLEKRPNLLCYNLILPLLAPEIPSREAATIAGRIGSSTATARVVTPPSVSNRPSLKAPSLKVEKLPDRTSRVRIYAPFLDRGVASEYLQVSLDCLVDVERSALTLHGDYLSARLAFTEYSSAKDAREERQSQFPGVNELDAFSYARAGIICRKCEGPLVDPNVIKTVYRSPQLPWGDLLECLTCVKTEDYISSQTVDIAFKFSDKRLVPPPASLLVSETYISTNGQNITTTGLQLRPYASGAEPILLNEFEDSAKSRDWLVAFCPLCESWIGDARRSDGSAQIIEARFFKANVRTETVFLKYGSESVLCGAVLDAATTRECYRFVLACCKNDGICAPLFKLVLLSYDTWLSTDECLYPRPIMKFLYWRIRQADADEADKWAQRTGAERIVLPSEETANEIAAVLESSTTQFPHSLRGYPDGSSLGFLKW